MKILLLILLLLAVPAWSADREVRDRNGTLIETWETNGSTTEVRDRNGRLLETSVDAVEKCGGCSRDLHFGQRHKAT